ncbi:hypothetical protein EHV15_17645 [Paenibacillus oralis]|uniref:DUF3887 domain-containing protein n=1 Tax=Paenibacillus oralis TaxID=2490856 RepID=A0A3P3U420_9BACL|nr:hypothetical protein [Paenibacillus oralis]RRJ64546.1 hypothetical protein EHV15_17645 [Paenibacillus oralis]
MKKIAFACFIICVMLLAGCSGAKADESPRQTLERYMQAIAEKDAEQLVALYGGSYEGLIHLFPDTDPDHKQQLFEQYMKLLPDISLKEIIAEAEESEGLYKFTVTFQLEDGTLFETREFDTVTNQFTYTVIKTDGGLKVMELPPYQA